MGVFDHCSVLVPSFEASFISSVGRGRSSIELPFATKLQLMRSEISERRWPDLYLQSAERVRSDSGAEVARFFF